MESVPSDKGQRNEFEGKHDGGAAVGEEHENIRDDGPQPSSHGPSSRALVRKLDLALIPIIMGLYLFSFIDRVNIGNARLYRLEADLGLVGPQYQTAVSILFVTYVLFEVPSNLVLKRFTPSRWIGTIATLWGVVATLTGLVRNYPSLVACRLLLGVFEAGLFPGLNVYLTLFYTKHQLALRVGYLFVSAAVAGALGGLLAFGVGHMDGVAGMSGWRWIMIIEGLPSFVLGIVAFFALPDGPGDAYFLTDAERGQLAASHAAEYGNTASAQEFSRRDMMKAFKDWKVWLFCLGQFGTDTMLYGYSAFLPTIINGLGKWTSAEVQLLTVPCYFLGAATYMAVAVLSDRYQRRAVFTVIFGIVSVVGYAVLISPASSGVHYFGCFLVAAGLYVVVGLPLAWLPNNSPRYGKRTTATGMQLTVGNTSGIMAPFIYLTGDAPRYIRGHATTMAMVAMATCIFAFLWFWFRRANMRRAAGNIPQEQLKMSEEQLAELGDESHRYRYTI